MLAWLCAAAALSYISRNAIAVAESTVRADLGLTMEERLKVGLLTLCTQEKELYLELFEQQTLGLVDEIVQPVRLLVEVVRATELVDLLGRVLRQPACEVRLKSLPKFRLLHGGAHQL